VAKKQITIVGAIGLVMGIIGGIAGTAFSMGADQQRINDAIIRNSAEIQVIKDVDSAHEISVQQQMNRYVDIIIAQMTSVQDSIQELTTTVGQLSTDVQILQVLLERVEDDIEQISTPN